MEALLFCMAKTRPSYCMMETNICCSHCKKNSMCRKSLAKESKLKPCRKNENELLDPCEFAI